jgi:stage V sporulation protein R
VRDALVRGLTNFGQPYIVVEDGDYNGNGELFLRHCFEGQELDMKYAQRTLEQVFRLWRRPVCLATERESKATVLRFDGQAHNTQTPA